ncbi:flagellar motor protein MotB [Denitratisoma oestradiolicum]|uniref:Protein that enables flagellar motor rotation n=1 Tax=Denitratisoma oestradiolicum TaxID=311182 RepID=A0A6S6XZN8_9PROT|nr:flagellar motor protein MotB [Denitratisoma oestradiolicum]TWO81617.1 flagellar motor protein MotB [Denitratisoma oestradiolicum]CAB1370558.1 protein that enables flagellar motor rotation [Denitratisoma oestradiolicum]
MSDDSQQPIVVKRIKKGGAASHGGAWKIAYADFVTAMMAFFLLMWLLGSTTQGDLKGIADYFSTPLKVALGGGSGAGDSSSLIQGGGEDLSRAHGQVKRGDIDAPRRNVNLQALEAEFERMEQQRLESLKTDLEDLIDSTPTLKQFKSQMLLDLTSEGLRIQIVDEKSRPMFDSASSELKPYTRDILREIGKALNRVENHLSLSGHTDATPYAGGDKGFGNWELSTNRANASRRELVAGGMADSKVMRVVGLASTVLYDKSDPYNPINRRISIVVMNKRTEEALLRDGKVAEVEGGAAAGRLDQMAVGAEKP